MSEDDRSLNSSSLVCNAIREEPSADLRTLAINVPVENLDCLRRLHIVRCITRFLSTLSSSSSFSSSFSFSFSFLFSLPLLLSFNEKGIVYNSHDDETAGQCFQPDLLQFCANIERVELATPGKTFRLNAVDFVCIEDIRLG